MYVFVLFVIVFQSIQSRTIAVITDAHVGATEHHLLYLEKTVSKINKEVKEREIESVFMLGDLASHSKYDELFLSKKVLDKLSVPYFVVPGNHDISEDFHFRDVFSSSLESKTEFYTFNDRNTVFKDGWRPIHNFVLSYPKKTFIFLDWNWCNATRKTERSKGFYSDYTFNFLKDILARTSSNKQVFILQHYPFETVWYSVGKLFSSSSKTKILSLLEDHQKKFGNIVAILAGHIHVVPGIDRRELSSTKQLTQLTFRALFYRSSIYMMKFDTNDKWIGFDIMSAYDYNIFLICFLEIPTLFIFGIIFSYELLIGSCWEKDFYLLGSSSWSLVSILLSLYFQDIIRLVHPYFGLIHPEQGFLLPSLPVSNISISLGLVVVVASYFFGHLSRFYFEVDGTNICQISLFSREVLRSFSVFLFSCVFFIGLYALDVLHIRFGFRKSVYLIVYIYSNFVMYFLASLYLEYQGICCTEIYVEWIEKIRKRRFYNSNQSQKSRYPNSYSSSSSSASSSLLEDPSTVFTMKSGESETCDEEDTSSTDQNLEEGGEAYHFTTSSSSSDEYLSKKKKKKKKIRRMRRDLVDHEVLVAEIFEGESDRRRRLRSDGGVIIGNSCFQIFLSFIDTVYIQFLVTTKSFTQRFSCQLLTHPFLAIIISFPLAILTYLAWVSIITGISLLFEELVIYDTSLVIAWISSVILIGWHFFLICILWVVEKLMRERKKEELTQIEKDRIEFYKDYRGQQDCKKTVQNIVNIFGFCFTMWIISVICISCLLYDFIHLNNFVVINYLIVMFLVLEFGIPTMVFFNDCNCIFHQIEILYKSIERVS